jgi:hypothetical protein
MPLTGSCSPCRRYALPKLQFRQHMLRYQTMMRTPTRESYGRFWGSLRALFDVSSGPLQDILVYFIGAEAKLGFEYLEQLPPGALRVTQSSLMKHVQHWCERVGGRLRVIHNSSAALAKEKWAWDAILTADGPPSRSGTTAAR